MKNKAISWDLFAGLVLFLLFALTMLLVVATGANAYEDINQAVEEQYTQRTGLSYIGAKVHASNGDGQIQVVDFQGLGALSLTEIIDGTAYATLIYCYGGFLMELYAAVDAGLSPADGVELIPMDSVAFNLVADNLLQVTMTNQDGDGSIYLHLVGGGI